MKNLILVSIKNDLQRNTPVSHKMALLEIVRANALLKVVVFNIFNLHKTSRIVIKQQRMFFGMVFYTSKPYRINGNKVNQYYKNEMKKLGELA